MRLMITVQADYANDKMAMTDLMAALDSELLTSLAFEAHGLEDSRDRNEELWELMKDNDGCIRLDIDSDAVSSDLGKEMVNLTRYHSASILHFYEDLDENPDGVRPLVGVCYWRDGVVSFLDAKTLDTDEPGGAFKFLVSPFADREFMEISQDAQLLCNAFYGREPRQAQEASPTP